MSGSPVVAMSTARRIDERVGGSGTTLARRVRLASAAADSGPPKAISLTFFSISVYVALI